MLDLYLRLQEDDLYAMIIECSNPVLTSKSQVSLDMYKTHNCFTPDLVIERSVLNQIIHSIYTQVTVPIFL